MRCARLLAAGLVLAMAMPAAAARREASHARPPPRPAAPAAAVPAPTPAAAQAATGLCQCIADRSKRNISCLGSAQACQSACATTHYSFIPFAPYCPATAQ